MSQRSNNTQDETTNTAELTESDRHRLLMAERRRLTLEILAENPVPVELEELAAEIAARGDGLDDEEVIEHVAITLHHTHLPKMANLGVLDYDTGAHQIDPSGALIESLCTNHLDNY